MKGHHNRFRTFTLALIAMLSTVPAYAQTGNVNQDARRAAELEVQLIEDIVDSQTQSINARPQAETQRMKDEMNAIVRGYRGTDNGDAFEIARLEAMVALLRERSAMTTLERTGRSEPRNAYAKQQAAYRDRASWVSGLPRPEAVEAAFPGSDEASITKRIAAIRIVADNLPNTQNANVMTLKGTLLTVEYKLKLAQIEGEHQLDSEAGEPLDERVYETMDDEAFRSEALQRFLPDVVRAEAADDYRRQISTSAETGAKSAIVLSVVLCIALFVWSIASWIGSAGKAYSFTATETDGRLDVTYRGSIHGIGALITSLLFWYFLMVIWICMGSMTDWDPVKAIHEEQPGKIWLANFIVMFVIVGTPVAALFLFNLLRIRKRRFSITPEHVIVGGGGRKFPREHVGAYFVNAPGEGAGATIARSGSGTTATYIYGSGPQVALAYAGASTAAAMNAGRAAAAGVGNALYVMLSRVRYSVCMAYGENRKTLARDLSEKRADAILARIAEFLDAEEVQAQDEITAAADSPAATTGTTSVSAAQPNTTGQNQCDRCREVSTPEALQTLTVSVNVRGTTSESTTTVCATCEKELRRMVGA